MKNRGSCGLKHARYDTSCRLLAARCRLVQNSLTSVSTTIGRRLARPTLVICFRVARPFQRNARSSRSTPGEADGEGSNRGVDEVAWGTEPSYREELRRRT